MGVYFRTGEQSAASISWPVYILFVLPLQLLYGFFKVILLAFKWLVIGLVAAWSLIRGRKESRPPAA